MKKEDRIILNEILNLLNKFQISSEVIERNQDPNKYKDEFEFAKMLNLEQGRFHYWLEFLKDEGYVRLIFHNNENNLKWVFLEEKGKIFIKNNGYTWWNMVFKANITLITAITSMLLGSASFLVSSVGTYNKQSNEKQTLQVQNMIDTMQFRVQKMEKSIELLSKYKPK